MKYVFRATADDFFTIFLPFQHKTQKNVFD